MIKLSFAKKTLITTFVLSTLFTINQAKGNWFVTGGIGMVNSNFTNVKPYPKVNTIERGYNSTFTTENSLSYKLSTGYEFTNFGISLDYNLMPYAKTKEILDFAVKQEAVYATPYLHFNAGFGRIFLKAGVGLSYAKQRFNNYYNKEVKNLNYDNNYYRLTSPNAFNLPAGNYRYVIDETIEKNISKFNNVVRSLAWKLGAGYEYNIVKGHSVGIEYEYLHQKAVAQEYVFPISYSQVSLAPYSVNPNGASGSVLIAEDVVKPYDSFDIIVKAKNSTQNIHAINLVYKYKFGA